MVIVNLSLSALFELYATKVKENNHDVVEVTHEWNKKVIFFVVFIHQLNHYLGFVEVLKDVWISAFFYNFYWAKQ